MKKYWKILNFMPLIMFVLTDALFGSGINPVRLIIVVGLAIMNIILAKDLKDYLISSAILLVSSVVGMILDTYYYYYFISSDSETPIVGAFIAMVYGIYVILLTLIGAIIVHFKKNGKQTRIENDENN